MKRKTFLEELNEILDAERAKKKQRLAGSLAVSSSAASLLPLQQQQQPKQAPAVKELKCGCPRRACNGMMSARNKRGQYTVCTTTSSVASSVLISSVSAGIAPTDYYYDDGDHYVLEAPLGAAKPVSIVVIPADKEYAWIMPESALYNAVYGPQFESFGQKAYQIPLCRGVANKDDFKRRKLAFEILQELLNCLAVSTAVAQFI
jgi:hypothetical protein